MTITAGLRLTINAPEFFRDPAFVAWLNDGASKFTIHRGGEPGEWSDVIVLVDPSLSGEGSDSDMPAHIWEAIVDTCRAHAPSFPGLLVTHIAVHLTNLE